VEWFLVVYLLHQNDKEMAVRNSRPRTQDNYIHATHNGQRFMLEAGSFQTKSTHGITLRNFIDAFAAS
jgi:hypothetical protein